MERKTDPQVDGLLDSLTTGLRIDPVPERGIIESKESLDGGSGSARLQSRRFSKAADSMLRPPRPDDEASPETKGALLLRNVHIHT